MHIGFWWKSEKTGTNVGGRILFKWILEQYDAVVWI
jgi:hypothetical protein